MKQGSDASAVFRRDNREAPPDIGVDELRAVDEMICAWRKKAWVCVTRQEVSRFLRHCKPVEAIDDQLILFSTEGDEGFIRRATKKIALLIADGTLTTSPLEFTSIHMIGRACGRRGFCTEVPSSDQVRLELMREESTMIDNKKSEDVESSEDTSVQTSMSAEEIVEMARWALGSKEWLLRKISRKEVDDDGRAVLACWLTNGAVEFDHSAFLEHMNYENQEAFDADAQKGHALVERCVRARQLFENLSEDFANREQDELGDGDCFGENVIQFRPREMPLRAFLPEFKESLYKH